MKLSEAKEVLKEHGYIITERELSQQEEYSNWLERVFEYLSEIVGQNRVKMKYKSIEDNPNADVVIASVITDSGTPVIIEFDHDLHVKSLKYGSIGLNQLKNIFWYGDKSVLDKLLNSVLEE